MNSHQRTIGFGFINILFLLIFTVVITSCNSNDPVPIIEEESCNDGILNQGELLVDCGGPCPPCVSKMTALVSSTNWSSSGTVTSILNTTSQQLLISGSSGGSDISIIHDGSQQVGSYNIGSAIYTVLGTNETYISNDGNISFSKWDKFRNIVEGSFNFKAFSTSGSGDSIVVSNGTFEKVSYQ